MSLEIAKSNDGSYGIVTHTGVVWFDGDPHVLKEKLRDLSLAQIAYIHACCHFRYASLSVFEYLKLQHTSIPDIECDIENTFFVLHEKEEPKDARLEEKTEKQEFSTPYIPGLRARALVKNGYIETTQDNLDNAKLCASMHPMPIRIGKSILHFTEEDGKTFIKERILNKLTQNNMMWTEVHCPTYAKDVIRGILIYNGSAPTKGQPTKHTIGNWFYYTWETTTGYHAILYPV